MSSSRKGSLCGPNVAEVGRFQQVHKHNSLWQFILSCLCCREEVEQQGSGAEAEGLPTKQDENKFRTLRLRFLNEMISPIYRDEEIRSLSNEAIKIGIFDGDEMVKSDQLSKLKIEILALEGNFPYDVSDSWTSEEFSEHRAGGRDGNRNLLTGEGTTVQLINGECDLGSIRFREASCRARKGMFILGARVCDGEAVGFRVQEAITKPVVVQERRIKCTFAPCFNPYHFLIVALVKIPLF
jgi:hypothetical protein